MSIPPAPTLNAALYARVSTLDQHCEMQLREVGDWIARQGWAQSKYVELISTRKRRPELQRVMADAIARKVDCVVVWKLDRFGRSLSELVENIETLDRAGVRFICMSQGIDTDKRNPTSRFLLHILASVAEFERDLTGERRLLGQNEYNRAFEAGEVGPKDKGKRESRSGKNLAAHRPLKVFRRAEAFALRAAGMSWRKIAERLNVPFSTVRRAVAALKTAPKPTKPRVPKAQ